MYLREGKRKNLKFVYLYLKECYTICVSVRVRTPYQPKIKVGIGKISGFPKIIPGRLSLLMPSDRKVYIAVMTLLGIHRIIPWWPAIDYTTITEKFSGLFKTLAPETLYESKRRLCELANVKADIVFTSLRAVTLIPESAGPSSTVS